MHPNKLTSEMDRRTQQADVCGGSENKGEALRGSYSSTDRGQRCHFYLSPTLNSCCYPDIYMGLHGHLLSLMSTTSQARCPVSHWSSWSRGGSSGKQVPPFPALLVSFQHLVQKSMMDAHPFPHCLRHLQISSLMAE